MRSCWLQAFVIVGLTILSDSVWAQYTWLPIGRQRVARVDGDKIDTWLTFIEWHPETRMRRIPVTVDGQTVEQEQTYTVMAPVFKTAWEQIELERAKAVDPQQKPIGRRQLARRLKEPQHVLAVQWGYRPDPRYLRLLRKDTIVLLAPEPRPLPAGTEAPQIPEGLALTTSMEPYAAEARLTEAGQLEVKQMLVTVRKGKGVLRDSEPAEPREPSEITETVRQETTRLYEAESYRAQTAAGEAIAAADLGERLDQGTAVLVSGDGRAIDPNYLKIIRDDAIVLILPQE